MTFISPLHRCCCIQSILFHDSNPKSVSRKLLSYEPITPNMFWILISYFEFCRGWYLSKLVQCLWGWKEATAAAVKRRNEGHVNITLLKRPKCTLNHFNITFHLLFSNFGLNIFYINTYLSGIQKIRSKQ